MYDKSRGVNNLMKKSVFSNFSFEIIFNSRYSHMKAPGLDFLNEIEGKLTMKII